MSELAGWALGYLVNSLWQVPLIFAAGWLAARLIRPAGPRMEHRVWVTALLLEAVIPALPVLHGRLRDLLPGIRGLLALLGLEGAQTGGEVRVVVGAGTASAHGWLHLPAVVWTGLGVAYGCSVVYFAARLVWGQAMTARMRRQAESISLAGERARSWERCRTIFSLRAPEIAVSPRVSGPVTAGLWTDALLVPPGFLEAVSEDELCVVFAHEFAHMRRRDALKNAVYGVLTLPVAYHPLLWGTRARVAGSREMVCDALAAEALAGPEKYARSLLRLAAMLANGRPVMKSHAIGIFDANLFERRVMTLTKKRATIGGLRRFAMVAACAVVGMLTCASALALRLEVTGVQGASGTAEKSGAPVRVSGGVMAGNSLTKVNPVYPQDAKDAKIQGAVVLRAVIGKDGVVENLQVVSGPEKLRRPSLDAVRQWTYKPYLLNGQPVEVDTTITVTYSLQP